MKKILIFLMINLLFFAKVESQMSYTVNINANDLSINVKTAADSNMYSSINITKLYSFGDTGKPALPVKYIKFYIPVGKDVDSISIIPSSATTYNLTTKVFPVQKPIRASTNSTVPSFTIPDPSVYNSNTAFPTQMVKLVHNGYFDVKNRIVTIAVIPFQYYPLMNKLEFYSSINITVTLKQSVSSPVITVKNRSQHIKSMYADILKSMVINPQDIPTDTTRYDTANGKFFNYVHYGYIAQDVKNIFPNLVYQKDDGFLALNYTELIPLIIETIKQQDSIITSLQQQVNNCCNKGSVEKTDDQTGINDNNNSIATPLLYQNNPNPFSKQTQIKCFIPDNATISNIYIYDMQGTQIKKIQINGNGNEAITIQGSELKAGMYMYSLIIDGKVIDTKKMVLTD